MMASVFLLAGVQGFAKACLPAPAKQSPKRATGMLASDAVAHHPVASVLGDNPGTSVTTYCDKDSIIDGQAFFALHAA